MKKYVGRRDEHGLTVMVVDGDSIRPLRHVIVHSPSGFECGYMGSGPADLALSILADYTGEANRLPAKVFKDYCYDEMEAISNTKAWRYHQHLKRDIIAKLTRRAGSEWVIPEDVIQEYLEMLEIGTLRREAE